MLGVNIESREFEYFYLNEVNYINLKRLKKGSEQVPVYHTLYGSFAAILTLKELSMALKSHGFNYYDQSTLVNIRRIRDEKKDDQGLKITFIDSKVFYVSPRSRMK